MKAARKESMSRLKHARAGVGALAVIAAAAVAVPAFAAAPSRVVQKIVGGTKVVPNRSITDTMHFKKDVLQIKKGGTIVLVDTTKAPHTLSIVKRKQVPRTARQVDNCFGK